MSERDSYRDYRGSSRSGRHNSDRDNHYRSRRDRSRSGERSTSRDRRSYEKDWHKERHEKSSSSKDHGSLQEVSSYDKQKTEPTVEENNDVPPPPPPPRISMVMMGFKKTGPQPNPIKLSLTPSTTQKAPTLAPKQSVASVFNEDDDDDEPEEMPAEARMRMRNIGRETPTSAGPNSFGKTKQGFCDINKVFERNMKKAIDQVSGDGTKAPTNFPQTIYRLGNNRS